MRRGSFLSYFFAGAFLMNSIPHLIVAFTGRRNPTAFGLNSSPLVNLLWGGINVAIGSLLFRFADSREQPDSPDSKAWQLPYTAGCLVMSMFGILYSWLVVEKQQKRNEQD